MSPVNLAVLISGSGSTMDSVLAAVAGGTLKNVNPVIVISSNPAAAGIRKAAARGIPTAVTERHLYKSAPEFGDAILKLLTGSRATHVAQLGWLPLTPKNVIREFDGRIFNQHPGPLDPGREDFGGKGMFGVHVHAAVIAYQMLTGHVFPTEATTHLVTEEFDKGMLLSTMPLMTGVSRQVDTGYFEDEQNVNRLETDALKLAGNLLVLEHENVIGTLARAANGSLQPAARAKPLIPAENIAMLGYSKRIAARIG